MAIIIIHMQRFLMCHLTNRTRTKDENITYHFCSHNCAPGTVAELAVSRRLLHVPAYHISAQLQAALAFLLKSKHCSLSGSRSPGLRYGNENDNEN